MSQATEGPLHGCVWVYYEMGYAGSIWAFKDERFPDLYDGLYILETGDELKIFSKENPTQVVWEGTVALTPPGKIPYGHYVQAGMDMAAWRKWFFEEHPAELIPKK